MKSEKEIIKQIRRRWGVDSTRELDPESQATLDHYREQLGNSLDLLSDQLYQSEAHFFLELLQNADDNEYEASVRPSLDIRIESHQIVFTNNERGFSEANVRALCGVGNSTKKGRKQTQIGEKGIGFKAVFQITDQPEIHSRGFHFRFNRGTHRELGLVIPEWCEGQGDGQGSTHTTIVLPIRDGHALTLDLIAAVDPALLLFLRRLRRLHIEDVQSDCEVTVERFDDGHILEVSRSTRVKKDLRVSKHRFFVHRRAVSMEGVHDKLRADVTDTEVVVAFPIDDDGGADPSAPRTVYAFLPVCVSEFRFVCHADFVLSASRESIQRERPWNIRLRDELGMAMAEAIVASQIDTALGRSCLRFLVDPKSVVDPFLKEMIANCIAEMKRAACVPTADAAYSKPSIALRHDNTGLSLLVDGDAAKRLLGKQYVDREITGVADALTLLGVDSFTMKDLLRCLQDVDWVKSGTSKWFARVIGVLGSLQLKGSESAELKKCSIVRLSTGAVVPATTRSVFRKIDKRTTYGFEDEFQIVDPAVLASLASDKRDGALKLLTSWGIRDASVSAVIEDHILRIHGGNEWKDRSVSALRGHARFVRDHLAEYLRTKGDDDGQSKALDTIRSALWLHTCQEQEGKNYVSRPAELYLGSAYRDPYRIEVLFGDAIKNSLISKSYLADDTAIDQKKSRLLWSAFFERVGAHIRPRVVSSGTDWVLASEVKSIIDGEDEKKGEHLLRICDKEWASHYSRFETNQYGRVSGFVSSLRELHVTTSSEGKEPIANCYLANEENGAVFGDSVPYLAGNWSSARFLEATGVTVSPTVGKALERLGELGDGTLTEKAVLAAVRKLYRFLDLRFDGHEDEISGAFRDAQLVYLNQRGKGGWSDLNGCCWSVPVELREFAPVHALSGVWSDYRDFFCEKLDLWETMTPDEWVTTLEQVAEACEDGEKCRRVVRPIYKALARCIEESDEEPENAAWLTRLKDGLLLWTKRGEWRRNDDDVVAPNDPRLEQLFHEKQKVGFLDVDSDELPYLGPFLTALGIRVLTKAVEVHAPTPRNSRVDELLGQQIHDRWRFIVRFLFHKHIHTYQECVDEGVLTALRNVRVRLYSPLELSVTLCGEEAVARFSGWSEVRPRRIRLFIDANSHRDWDVIAFEVAKSLRLEITETANIARLIEAKSPQSAEKYLDLLKVGDLPEEERQRWGESAGRGEQQDHVGEERDDQASSEDETRHRHEESRKPIESESFFGADDAEEDSDSQPEASDEGTSRARKEEALREIEEDSPRDEISKISSGDGEETSDDDGVTSADGCSDRTDEGAEGTAADFGVDGAARPTQHSGSGGGIDRVPGTRRESGEHTKRDGRQTNVSPPTAPDGSTKPSSRPSRGRGRLISYVGAEKCDATDDWDRERRSPDRSAVAQGAVDCARDAEIQEGRQVTVMPHNHPGYDIEARSAQGEVERFIEVKGIDGEWDECGVVLSHTQFKFAEKHRERFWLYVVEFATDPQRRCLFKFQNMFEKANSYGFDYGWKEAADQKVVAGQQSRESLVIGARIRLSDGRGGLIKSISQAGVLTSVAIRLDDGVTINWTQPRTVLLAALIEEPTNGPDAAGSQ